VSRAADPGAVSTAQHYSPGTPLVLVGTKEDLRGTVGQLDDGREEVSYEKGKELRDEIKALSYLECSAITKNGIKVHPAGRRRVRNWGIDRLKACVLCCVLCVRAQAVFDTAVRVCEGLIRGPSKPKSDKKCILL
jgi:hypothetical protein